MNIAVLFVVLNDVKNGGGLLYWKKCFNFVALFY